jgi:hypothetical protein
MQALSDAFTIGSTLVGGYGLIKGGVQLIGTVAYSVERQAAIQAMRGGGTAAASAYYKGAGRNLILDATIFSHTVTTQSRAEAVLRWLPGPATYYKWQDQMKACAK